MKGFLFAMAPLNEQASLILFAVGLTSGRVVRHANQLFLIIILRLLIKWKAIFAEIYHLK